MEHKQAASKTLRLLMPQWQGGNNGVPYPMGARLLAWLAPESDAPLVEVPVDPYAGAPLPLECGIRGRQAIMHQLRAARNIIDAHRPDRIIVFGGDCLVSQAPFAYLNERYRGKLGVLWLDAHPDVTTPKEFEHAHAMVLGNLLGEGDPELAREVPLRLDPHRVMLGGVDEMNEQETEVVTRLGIRRATSQEMVDGGKTILDWIRKNDIRHLAIHLDLDILDPKRFRSLLFNNPDSDVRINAPEGKLTIAQLSKTITDVSKATEVVGIGFAEHMPWDDINLKNMMEGFSFMK